MNMPINDTVMVTAARLHVAPENPRSAESADAREVADLAANIATLGLLTPLIAYREGADFFVTAGGRRTRALHALVDERRIADTASFPVSVLDKDAAINAGHAEQLTHAVMSDLDTLRVFRRAEYEHWTDAELGKLVGRSARFVAQRRAILALGPEVTEALVDGQITVNQGAGLTYFKDDAAALAEHLDACKGNPRIDGNDLRAAFERQVTAWDEHALTKLVSKDAYLAAGGKLQGDLFAEAQFILSMDVLTALAREEAASRVAAAHADAGFIIDANEECDVRVHPGVNRLSAEEAEEWADIRYEFWTEDKERDAFETDDDWAFYRHWCDLSKKAERYYPDELACLLGVAWKLNRWSRNDPIQITQHVLPDDLDPLYAGGWLTRPVEVAPEPDADQPPEEKPLSDALVRRIGNIRLHCQRQDMMKRPGEVLAAYLGELVGKGDPGCFDNRTGEPLTAGDPEPIYSAAWQKAEAAVTEDVASLKPAQQRAALAFQLLSRLASPLAAVPVTGKMLRDFVKLDAIFFKGYGKARMVKMLEGLGIEAPGKAKVAELADALAEAFQDRDEWLPEGF